jgi:hypothetical protein
MDVGNNGFIDLSDRLMEKLKGKTNKEGLRERKRKIKEFK